MGGSVGQGLQKFYDYTAKGETPNIAPLPPPPQTATPDNSAKEMDDARRKQQESARNAASTIFRSYGTGSTSPLSGGAGRVLLGS